MVPFVLFIAGLSVGSFLNVIIRRGIVGKPPTGRSHCEHCGRTLAVVELIPVISFLVQKGRCRSCGAALSWQYPLVEVLTGLSYAAVPFIWPTATPEIWLGTLIVLAALIVIFVSDILYYIIPDGAVLILLVLGLWRTFTGSPKVLTDITAALILAAFLAMLWLLSSGRWMGLGDAKLMLVLGLLLGLPALLVAWLFSFWLGGTVGIILLISRAVTVKSKIPFGPFLIAGSILAYFFSQQFLEATGLILFL